MGEKSKPNRASTPPRMPFRKVKSTTVLPKLKKNEDQYMCLRTTGRASTWGELKMEVDRTPSIMITSTIATLEKKKEWSSLRKGASSWRSRQGSGHSGRKQGVGPNLETGLRQI